MVLAFANSPHYKTLLSLLKPNKQSIDLLQVVTHVRDPDAAADDDMDNPDQYPPNIFWRVIAACMYMIPWIDAVGLGREIYHKFPSFIYLYFMTGRAFKRTG